MIVVFPLHVLAVIVFGGGLFFVTIVFRPGTVGAGAELVFASWQRTLARFFASAWVSLLIIVATGIAMVFLEFGGFADVPMLHRVNAAVGIPAIALLGYVHAGPWRQCRRTLARRDWPAAAAAITKVQWLLRVVMTMGLAAALLSAVGRYA